MVSKFKHRRNAEGTQRDNKTFFVIAVDTQKAILGSLKNTNHTQNTEETQKESGQNP